MVNIIVEEIAENVILQIDEVVSTYTIVIDETNVVVEYENLFTYLEWEQVFSIPLFLKIMSVTLNDGRVLKKTIDWTRNESQITILYPLEVNDTIYITGFTS